MTGPVEWLVGLVLGVDALVIAGILVSRLSGRSRRRNGNGSVAVADSVPIDRLQTYAASTASAPPDAPTPESAASVDTPSVADAEAAEPGDLDIVPGEAALDEPADAAADTATAETPDESAPWPVEEPALAGAEEPLTTIAGQSVAPLDVPEPPPTDWDAAVAETPAIPERASRPMGLDFGPTWVDPVSMAAEAAAEWRRTLRRELALAAWRGRPAMIMNLKLDIEDSTELAIPDVARFEGQLHQTIGRLVRSSDHFDRTGPGRFHVILSEMAESAALAVAERIRHGFAEAAGSDAPRLLIGCAAMETEGDVALALQRAAERLDGVPDLPEAAPPVDEL